MTEDLAARLGSQARQRDPSQVYLHTMIPSGLKIRWARWTMRGMHRVGIRKVEKNLVGGGVIKLYTQDELAQRIKSETTFEPLVRQEIQRLVLPGCNVIDVGANIGYYTILSAHRTGSSGRIFSFEPQPEMIARLRENVGLNRLSNVTIFEVALSDQADEVKFYVPTPGREAHGSMQSNQRFRVSRAISVKTQRLDDTVAQLGSPSIDLIKLDAEGAELPVLKGATGLLQRDSRPAIIFEANEENCRPFGYCVFDLLNFIHSYGYALRQLDEENWIAERDLHRNR